MLSRQERELLVAGFARCNYNENMPYDIILLFIEWINTTLYAIIQGNKMMEFKLQKHNECMDQKYIIKMTEDISFECSLYPKGYGFYDECSWKVKLITKNDNIHRVCAYLECGIEEVPNSIYKETTDSFHYSEDESVVQEIVPFSKCNNKDTLTIYLYIQLISYTMASAKDAVDVNNEFCDAIYSTKYLMESPVFDAHIEYEWIIDNNKCLKGDWVFSLNFMNDCIGLFCTPKGKLSDGPDSRITLGIDFYQTPHSDESMEVKIRFETNVKFDDGTCLECERVNKWIADGSNVLVSDPRFTAERFEQMETIIIKVTIDIPDLVENMHKVEQK